MLRPELAPRDLDHGALTAQLEHAYARIGSGDAASTVAEDLSRESGIEIDDNDLLGFYGSQDAEEVAKLLLMPPRHELAKLELTREELVEVASRFLDGDDEHEQWWTALFDANVPHPNGHLADEDAETPEALTDAALAYRPFEL